jgi:UDP-N-acetylglucosamine--N-acetylmuramyl-(pentapeptide) pyrophosphoryl-undecaprenol N-acetylglucosamine transferase
MRVMITGGGTGGHTSPALAVLDELRQRDPGLAVQWVGRTRGFERDLCRRLSIPYRGLTVAGWPRKNGPRRLLAGGKLMLGVAQAWLLLRRFRPQLVFGVGGYVSLPLAWTAQRMGIPVMLHEQNQLLGMANRLCAPRATRLFLSYPDTRGSWPDGIALITGNPVRPAFFDPPTRAGAREALGLDPAVPTVLVVGGSQGARRLNDAMIGVLSLFEPGSVQFIWMTGSTDAARARQAAQNAPVRADVFAFVDDMATACAAADLVVSRSGASSTAELAAMGKPCVLVPFPHATDNHQEENARAFERAGAAEVLLDADCTGERLHAVVSGLIRDPDRLKSMGAACATLARPGAAARIVEEMLACVFTGDPGDAAHRPAKGDNAR